MCYYVRPFDCLETFDTLNYREEGTLTREERRKSLRDNFNFLCLCEACDRSKEERITETKKCQEFRDLEQERIKIALKLCSDIKEKCEYIRQDIDNLHRMRVLASELGISTVQNIVHNILEEGFNSSCRGFKLASRLPLLNLPLRIHPHTMMKEAQTFAEEGTKLAVIVFGKEFSVTKDWEERRNGVRDFIGKGCSEQ